MPRAAPGEPSRRRSASVAGRAGPGRAVTWARTPSLPAGSSGDVLSPAPSTVTPSSFHSRPGATPSSPKVTVPDLSASRASFTRPSAGPAGGPRGEAGGAAPTPAGGDAGSAGFSVAAATGAVSGRRSRASTSMSPCLSRAALRPRPSISTAPSSTSRARKSIRSIATVSRSAVRNGAGRSRWTTDSDSSFTSPDTLDSPSASPALTRSSLRVRPSLPVAGTAGRSGGR